MEVERKKGLGLSNAVNTAGRRSNVCSKSQIVSAKLKEEEGGREGEGEVNEEGGEKKFIYSEDHLHSN